MINEIDNILFDLDGTLTNPKEGIINSVLYALKKLNIQESQISELDSFIFPPLRKKVLSKRESKLIKSTILYL